MSLESAQNVATEIKERFLGDARQVKSVLTVVRKGLAAVALVLHCVASLILTGIVFLKPFPYPATYTLMSVVLFYFLVLRFFAQVSGKHLSSVLLLLFNQLALVFFSVILIDQVQARSVVVEDRFVARKDVPELYVPATMYLLVAVVIGIQTFISWWQHRNISRPPPDQRTS